MQLNNFVKAILLIMFGVLFGVVSSYFTFKNSSVNQIINKEEKVYIQENTALTNAIKNIKSSIVGIKSGNKINGSGVIVTSDGLIVTLAENVPLGLESNISIDAEDNITYQVLKRDLANNLALIKVEKNNLSTRSFFDLSKIEEGMRVFILSKSFNYSAVKFFFSANEGIVKSFNEEIIKTNIVETGRVEGSPVFDIEGNILGLAYKDVNNFINIIPVSKIKSFAGL
ncbi:MAG: serine protease [Candidatus Paceibacterota bacterium]|jgi:S1-C subfamily serine protease